MTVISTWSPLNRTVASITNANPGVVTTSSPHGYFNGLQVRFFFPANFGFTQSLGQIYTITVLSPTTFSLNANTTFYSPFNDSVTTQTPQVIPVAEVALTLKNAEMNTLTPFGGGL